VQGAKHVFSYTIEVENVGLETIRLIRRHWYIKDGIFGEREVEGEGVIGQKPTLEPGEKFEYQSWCPVSDNFGSMRGFFTFEILRTGETGYADIKTFLLMPEEALN